MKIIAYTRAEIGSGASRRLRAAGMAPGIVYGGNSEPLNIKLDHNALFYALKREAFHSSILDLEIDGKNQQVLLRDFQVHAYKPVVLHLDVDLLPRNRVLFITLSPNWKFPVCQPICQPSSKSIWAIWKSARPFIWATSNCQKALRQFPMTNRCRSLQLPLQPKQPKPLMKMHRQQTLLQQTLKQKIKNNLSKTKNLPFRQVFCWFYPIQYHADTIKRATKSLLNMSFFSMVSYNIVL